MAPRQWCFPVAGCVAYRGYFEEAAAARVRGEALQSQGDDVVGRRRAGLFDARALADPLLSTVNRYWRARPRGADLPRARAPGRVPAGRFGIQRGVRDGRGAGGRRALRGRAPRRRGAGRWQARRRQRVELIARFTAARTDLGGAVCERSAARRAASGQGSERLALLAAELRRWRRSRGRPIRLRRLDRGGRSTMRIWPRSRPTTTGCRASRACFRSVRRSTCRASTSRRRGWRKQKRERAAPWGVG